MAAHRNELLIASSNRLGNGRAADLSYGAVDYRGEFVDHGEFGLLCQSPGDCHSELFTV